MGCSQLDEQQLGSHKEARADKSARRRMAHGYRFQLISVLPCVDDDAGELQPLVLMYCSHCLSLRLYSVVIVAVRMTTANEYLVV